VDTEAPPNAEAPPHRRKDAQRNRDAILLAAKELFADCADVPMYEVARRAGVSKGVVTYYFPARDELIWAVVATVFASIGEHVGSRLEDVPPGRFVATYLGAWVDYFRTYRREMMAIAELWTSFRDAGGRPHLDARTLGQERALVEAALTAGQAEGTLGVFSPRVMAVTLKAALDGLLAQLALDPALDLDAYRDELVALFDRATLPA